MNICSLPLPHFSRHCCSPPFVQAPASKSARHKNRCWFEFYHAHKNTDVHRLCFFCHFIFPAGFSLLLPGFLSLLLRFHCPHAAGFSQISDRIAMTTQKMVFSRKKIRFHIHISVAINVFTLFPPFPQICTIHWAAQWPAHWTLFFFIAHNNWVSMKSTSGKCAIKSVWAIRKNYCTKSESLRARFVWIDFRFVSIENGTVSAVINEIQWWKRRKSEHYSIRMTCDASILSPCLRFVLSISVSATNLDSGKLFTFTHKM